MKDKIIDFAKVKKDAESNKAAADQGEVRYAIPVMCSCSGDLTTYTHMLRYENGIFSIDHLVCPLCNNKIPVNQGVLEL